MSQIVPIINNGRTFSPYQFYTDFLENVAKSYSDKNTDVKFKLFELGDNYIFDAIYRIDPITIPLLLSLFEQLNKYTNLEIELLLYNNKATIKVLEFLYRCDFFYIAGNNMNPTYPIGRNIISYDKSFLGNFMGSLIRNEHKVRVYSINDDNLSAEIKNYIGEESQRDFLISHYTYQVREHFEELLFDNEFTYNLHDTYIDILSELITNGVLHSKSNTFALMFVDKYKTKFSISDNGIGLSESMKSKLESDFYKPLKLKSELSKSNSSLNLSDNHTDSLYIIFETLYYSSLKDRKGIFDLMTNVVLNSIGYFRIHTDNCQLIISNRMMDELKVLDKFRIELLDLHNKHYLKLINDDLFQINFKEISNFMFESFVIFFKKAIEKYNTDIKYSSIRFFRVKFKGVHIEVEIPNL